MRARNIKPGVLKNEILGTADPLYTILFEGLWMLADKEGRLEDRPLRIKGEVFPYREGLDCDAMLAWLEANGFILRYVVDGLRYIQVIEFKKHQSPHSREAASSIPESDKALPRSCLAPEKAVPSTNQGKGQAALIPDSGFSDSLIPDSQIADNAREAGAVWPKVRQEYPAGLYRESEWLVAEKQFLSLADRGEPPDKLFEAVTLYRAQQLAKKAIGTQFVLSPSKFFDDDRWRGPFPLPLTKADTRLNGNIDAAAEAKRQLFGDPK